MSSRHHRRRVRYFTNNLPDYCDNVYNVDGTCNTSQSSSSNTSNIASTTSTITTVTATTSTSDNTSLVDTETSTESGTSYSGNAPESIKTQTNPAPWVIDQSIIISHNSAADASIGNNDSANDMVQRPRVIIDKNDDAIKKRIIHLVNLIVEKQKCTSDESICDGGLYVGISGIAYMFNYLASATGDLFNSMERDFFTKQALRYLGPAIDYANTLEKSDRLSSVAYLLGFAGTFVAAALIYHNIGDAVNRDFYINKYSQIASKCLPIHYLTKGSDELLVGRAGYICGATFLNKSFGNDNKVIPEGVLLALALSSIKSGREYSMRKGLKNICPLMFSYYGTDYFGAAHGLSGILQALLAVPGIFNRRFDLERDIKRSVDYLLSLQTDSGNFPCALDELVVTNRRPEEDELVHWCHGAPGVIWLMARAYLIWKEDKYLDCCVKCGELVWNKGLLRKGPGICHGIAGNALVFLVLYRLTDNPKYLHRANQFQEFLFNDDFRHESRTPDSPYSLFEGWSGTICFLADLLQPEKSHFPLYFDPFDDISHLYKDVVPKI